jgi:DNA-binding response OmpR family regulator
MKITLLTKDKHLLKDLHAFQNHLPLPVEYLTELDEPLDIMSKICTENIALIIVDDDYLKPKSFQLIKSLRQVKKSLNIIFITSDDSIELGKEISSLSVQYYAIKPFSGHELAQVISSYVKPRHIH